MWNIHGLEQMVTCAKSVLEHTCLHKDGYNAHHAGDMDEIRDEVRHVVKHLKHIQRALSKELYSTENVAVWDYFDKMIVIVRDLQKHLLHPENRSAERYNHLIAKAKGELINVFNEMVEKCVKDHNLHDFYHIA